MAAPAEARDPAVAEVEGVLPARHLQFPLLDSLRAVAAISILVVHAAIFSQATANETFGAYLNHLDIGVPFFFLLSAFLLYRPFVAARVEGRPRPEFPRYFRRRFLRVIPAFWLVLTVSAIVPGMAGAFSENWWVYYGLLQNLPVYEATGTCAVDGFRCGIPVAWSLTVEVFFYLTLPLFVLLMALLHRRRPRAVGLPIELAVVAGLALISVVIMANHPESDLDLWLFYSPLGRAWWFGLGLALAAISVSVERREQEPQIVGWIRRHPSVPWLLAAALYVVNVNAFEDSLLAFPIVPQSDFVAQYLLVGVIAGLVLLPAIFGRGGGGFPRRVLAHPALAWLGLVSYGIFLWQFPVMIFLIDDVGLLDLWPAMDFPILLLVGFAGTVACAAASFYLLERPLMGWRAARPARRHPPARESS